MVVQRTQSGPSAQPQARNDGPGGGSYTVQRGDSMSAIAARNGVSLDALKAANPQIRNSSLIFPGDKVNIPGGGNNSRYTIQRGDSFSSIAAQHGTTTAALHAANPQIRNINRIYPGEVLTIPARGSAGGATGAGANTGAAPSNSTAPSNGATPTTGASAGTTGSVAGLRPDAASVRAAEYAERHVLPSSSGYCYRYVKQALQATGAVNTYLNGSAAKNAGPALQQQGFVNVLGRPGANIRSPYDAPPGAVLVYGAAPGATDRNAQYGHIEIRTQNGFASDYFSRNARTGAAENGLDGRGRVLIGVYIKPAPGGATGANATPAQTTTPTAPTSTSSTTSANGTINLRALFDPSNGSNSPAAIIIGNAEGTRTPSGGMTRAYAGHIDPGNGVGNRGSFSYQHGGPGMTPAQADVAQLTRLNRQIPAFEAAARSAGIDPNNVTVATAYFDLYNQSPLAAGRFLNQMGYLAEAGISTQSVTELRFRSYVDVNSGERFKIRASNGNMVPGAGGFANIAKKNLERQGINRAPTEAEIHQVIRNDQARRMRAMAGAIAQIGTGTDSSSVPQRPAQGGQASAVQPNVSAGDGHRRFTANANLDLSTAVINSANLLYDSVATATGYRLHVTSGRRGPDRQAAAMYDNWATNSAPSYRNKAAEQEIKAAYLDGRSRGLSKSQTVANMTRVIQSQVDQGVLISKHLSSKAIDIRTPPAAERQAVLNAIRANPAVQSVGVENDHLHIQFK